MRAGREEGTGIAPVLLHARGLGASAELFSNRPPRQRREPQPPSLTARRAHRSRRADDARGTRRALRSGAARSQDHLS